MKLFKTELFLQGVSGYWNFIQGLEWLQPESSKSYLCIDCEYRPHIPPQVKGDKASIWLYRSLENYSLSQKLSWLLSDKKHLRSCYQAYAFLQQEKYAEAMLVCLRSVERNQASLLSEIDPYLFLAKVNAREFHKIHRRCSSFPDAHMKPFEQNKQALVKTTDEKYPEIVTSKITIYGKIKPWSSMPNLFCDDLSLKKALKSLVQCKTTPSTPICTRNAPRFSPGTLKQRYASLQNSKRRTNPNKGILKKPNKTKHVIISNYDIIEHTPPLSSSQSSGTYVNEDLANTSTKSLPPDSISPMRKIMSLKSVPDYARTTQAGQKDYKRHPKKSFIEDGGMSIQPVATGYFPRPSEGQTLTSFLTSTQFARANAELDRENAHFNISEAMISAMEQIRCKRDLALSDEYMEESDPEIMDLKQRIRLRRNQKIVEMHRNMWSAALLSDGRTDSEYLIILVAKI